MQMQMQILWGITRDRDVKREGFLSTDRNWRWLANMARIARIARMAVFGNCEWSSVNAKDEVGLIALGIQVAGSAGAPMR